MIGKTYLKSRIEWQKILDIIIYKRKDIAAKSE